jgi:hypothetical protein
MKTSGGYILKATLDRNQARDVSALLRQFPDKMRSKVLRTGLRRWALKQLRSTRSAARSEDVRTRKDLTVKTKTYRRGRSIWCAVGVRWDIGSSRRDSAHQGWRAHFHDVGYRVWQKGVKADGTPAKKARLWQRNPNPRIAPFIAKNRGWRAGKRKKSLGGRVLLRTLYLTSPARQHANDLMPSIVESINKSVAEMSRG